MDSSELIKLIRQEAETAAEKGHRSKNQANGCYYYGMRDAFKMILNILEDSE